MNIKDITKWVKTGGKILNEYGPQIAAVGSAVCFVGGVIFAAKESPEAFKALDEQMEINPDMNIAEKAATVVSRMPKTVMATTSGLVLHILAWKKILAKLATATTVAAVVTQDNANLVKAAKDVVGKDKAEEILQRKDELKVLEETGSDSIIGRYFPFVFVDFGIVKWMSWDQFKTGWEQCVAMLGSNQELSLYDMMATFKAEFPPIIDCGWRCDTNGCGSDVHDYMRWASEELRYQANLFEYRPKCPGYQISFVNPPTEQTSDR